MYGPATLKTTALYFIYYYVIYGPVTLRTTALYFIYYYSVLYSVLFSSVQYGPASLKTKVLVTRTLRAAMSRCRRPCSSRKVIAHATWCPEHPSFSSFQFSSVHAFIQSHLSGSNYAFRFDTSVIAAKYDARG